MIKSDCDVRLHVSTLDQALPNRSYLKFLAFHLDRFVPPLFGVPMSWTYLIQ